MRKAGQLKSKFKCAGRQRKKTMNFEAAEKGLQYLEAEPRRLDENLRRKKEDELQRLLLKCHNEQERKAVAELYEGEAT
jgi:hypothetical protein